MSAIFFALCGVDGLDEALLYLGLALAIVATVQYGRSAVAQLRARSAAPSSST